MSLEEIQRLLLKHRISPNKLLGQNFMVEPSLYPKLCQYADIDFADVVLDAGAGFGCLTQFLSDKCKAVIAVEKDPQVASVLRENLKDKNNVTVIEGDVLKSDLPSFTKVIAIPPYYLSSQLVLWVLRQPVDGAVMILQREFCERLVAPVGSEQYGWLTIITQFKAEAKILDCVPKEMFYPSPQVDSVIVSLKLCSKKLFEVKDEVRFMALTKWLFTQRNKKIAKAVTPFLRSNLKLNKLEAEKLAYTLPFYDKRARELAPRDFGAISNAISD